MSRGIVVSLCGLALIACMAAPSGAGAATTFGADLTQTPANSSVNFNQTNVIAPGGAAGIFAPVSGILVSVRVKTKGAAGMGTVRVLTETSHPDAMTYGFLNTAPEIPIAVAANAGTGVINQALTRRPISMGQRLGWFINDPGSTIQEEYNDVTAECAYFGGPHAVDTNLSYTTASCNHNVILLSGTIEADADGDGYGDETQDLCPANATTHGSCPVPAPPPAKKKKCKKKKKSHSAAAAKKKCKKKGKH